MSIRINVQISVTESYETVFAYQSTLVKESFVKYELLDALSSFTDDVRLLINESKAVDKKEKQHLITFKEEK